MTGLRAAAYWAPRLLGCLAVSVVLVLSGWVGALALISQH